jgi:hypothetical protein
MVDWFGGVNIIQVYKTLQFFLDILCIFNVQLLRHLELRHIEEAMKGQFVWKRPERRENETKDDFEERCQDAHRLTCDSEYECLQQMAIMVFIGIAFQYGFQERHIISHLEIDKRIYDKCYQLFNKYSEIAREKAEKHILDFTTPAGRLYLKTSLIRNYLRHYGFAV